MSGAVEPVDRGDNLFVRMEKLGWLDRADRPAAPATPTVASLPPGAPAAARYARAALEREVEAVATAPEGTRNHTLNKAAWNLGTLAAAGHLDGQDVLDALTDAARRAGLDEPEIDRTVPRALTDAAKSPRVIPEPTGGFGAVPAGFTIDPRSITDGQRDVLADVVPTQFPRLDWHALWADETDEEWIVEPLIAAGRAVVIYSPPKAGKSLLTLEIAAGVATGRPVLGEPASEPRRVLYVDFENDPRGDTRSRLMSMGYGPGDLDNLVVLSYPSMAALDSPQGGQELIACATHYRCTVIIIDTLSRAVAGEENSNDTYLSFYRHTVLLCKQAGIAMIRLDHSGKDAEKGMRGASAKESDVDAVWRLTNEDDLQVILECTHHRMPITDKRLVLLRETVPHLRHVLDTSGQRSAFESKVAEVVAALDALDVPTTAGERAARQSLKRTGVAAKTSAIREALKRRRTTLSPWQEAHGDASE